MPTTSSSSSSSYFWHFSFSNAMVILFHINNNYTAQNWYGTGKQEPIRRTKIYFLDISLSKSLYYLSGIFVLFHFPSSPSKRLFFRFLYFIFFCVCLLVLGEENKNQNAINTEIDKDIWGEDDDGICLKDKYMRLNRDEIKVGEGRKGSKRRHFKPSLLIWNRNVERERENLTCLRHSMNLFLNLRIE